MGIRRVRTGMGLALALIEQDCGRDIALKISHELQAFNERENESTAIGDPCLQNPNHWGRFERLRIWLSENLHRDDLNIEAMAARMAMSPRNLFREFKKKVGVPPTSALNMLRLDKARHLLRNKSIPISSVAHQCGFSNARNMRCAFQSNFIVSPREYRRLFSD